ncbi:hypothetical protein ACPXB5_11225 [Micromonospora arida]|uniref:hypothetical protein n=1 Tax=Micromonospora arida TaxID=2203715 RepID=UPI003CF41B19
MAVGALSHWGFVLMSVEFSDVAVSDRFDGDDEVRFGLRGEVDWLSRTEVRSLRDHLTGLLGEVTSATPALVEGQEYRLLPGAHSGDSGSADSCFRDATRVRLTTTRPDSDGDVKVTILDGSRAGSAGFYVHTKFLAPLSAAAPEAAPAPAIEVGREYRLLPGATCTLSDGTTLPTNVGESVTRVKVKRSADDVGDLMIEALDGRSPGNVHHTAARFLAPLPEATPTPAASIAQAARTIASATEGRRHYVTARAFRDFADLIEGKSL